MTIVTVPVTIAIVIKQRLTCVRPETPMHASASDMIDNIP